MNPITDSVNSKIEIFLSEGIKLVQGDLHWEGDLKKDEVFQIKITVKSTKEGQWKIRSYVEGLLSGEADKGREYYLFFLVSTNSGQVSRTPFYSEYPAEGRAKELPINIMLDSPPRAKVGEEIVLTFSLIAIPGQPLQRN